MNNQEPFSALLRRAEIPDDPAPIAHTPEPLPAPDEIAIADEMARDIGAEAARSVTRMSNDHLARAAAARSAVDLVMRQRLVEHPTLKSEWTYAEVLRLLDDLAADSGGEIKLGGQHLGEGFK